MRVRRDDQEEQKWASFRPCLEKASLRAALTTENALLRLTPEVPPDGASVPIRIYRSTKNLPHRLVACKQKGKLRDPESDYAIGVLKIPFSPFRGAGTVTDPFWERLVLAAVGPLLTALLAVVIVNELTRRWQNRQKMLEIRTGLVSDVSEAVMEIVMAVQFVHLDPGEKRQKGFDDAYKTWEIRSAVIGTRLQAYLGNTTIPADWTHFSRILTLFYALEGVSKEAKEGELTHVHGELNSILKPSDQVDCTWTEIRKGILLQKTDIIQRILNAKMPVIGPT